MGKKKNLQNHQTNKGSIMATERALSPQQDLFCQEYIKDYNAGKAAERAKYSKKTAYSIGSQLLKKLKIQERMEFYKKQSLLNADVTIEGIVNELKALGYADVTEVFTEKAGVIVLDDIKKLPYHTRKAIKSFEMSKDGIKIKFHSKEKSLELLGRYLSMFSDKLQINGEMKTDNELVIKVIQIDNGAGPPQRKVKK